MWHSIFCRALNYSFGPCSYSSLKTQAFRLQKGCRSIINLVSWSIFDIIILKIIPLVIVFKWKFSISQNQSEWFDSSGYWVIHWIIQSRTAHWTGRLLLNNDLHFCQFFTNSVPAPEHSQYIYIFIIIIIFCYGASVHLIVEKNDLYNPLKCVLLCPAEEWKS